MASRALKRSRRHAERRLREESRLIRESFDEESGLIRECFDRQIGLVHQILPDLIRTTIHEMLQQMQIEQDGVDPAANAVSAAPPEIDYDDEVNDTSYVPENGIPVKVQRRIQPSRAVKRSRFDGMNPPMKRVVVSVKRLTGLSSKRTVYLKSK